MFDTAIIGIGAAGYTAAIYSARYKLSTIIIGAEEGGMGATAADVGNWPGIIDIKGPDLMDNFKKHALSFDTVKHVIGRVTELQKKSGGGFTLTLQDGATREAKSVIIATGSNKRHLGVQGEKEFAGKGVTYCATCDAFFYRGKTVVVIGGGDSAVEGAAIAAQVAKTVYLIHRRSSFRAEPYWVDMVKAKQNITTILETNVTEILGKQKVTGVKLDKPFQGSDTLATDGVFIEIGALPAIDLAKAAGCEIDKRGFLAVDNAQRTSVEGIFGAGDITNASNYFAQFATAAGEAAVAANSVFNYLQAGESSWVKNGDGNS